MTKKDIEAHTLTEIEAEMLAKVEKQQQEIDHLNSVVATLMYRNEELKKGTYFKEQTVQKATKSSANVPAKVFCVTTLAILFSYVVLMC